MKVQANNTKELITFFSWTMFFFFLSENDKWIRLDSRVFFGQSKCDGIT